MPPFRRKTTIESPLKDRVRDAAVEAARESQQRVIDAAREVAQQTPERAQQLRAAVAQLDVRWARWAPARWVRERFMQFVMNPLLDHYAARRATGIEKLQHLKGPVILVANHASHMDTPIILSALPRKLRKRTAVAAAADYFYRNRITAYLASLLFNTVPVDRKGGGGGTKGASHLDKLLDDGWNLLLYPEGSRKHGNESRSRAPRRRRAGLPPQPLDRADPRHRHRCGDAARARSGRSACAAVCSRGATASRSRSASRSRRSVTPQR